MAVIHVLANCVHATCTCTCIAYACTVWVCGCVFVLDSAGLDEHSVSFFIFCSED